MNQPLRPLSLDFPSSEQRPRNGRVARVFSRKAGAMLVRNTVVSCAVFSIGLLILWVLVEFVHIDQMIALAISLICANTLHYLIGRSWIFPGSDRRLSTGYVYFLVNAGIGMLVTMALFALLTGFTNINYLLIRVFVSLFAGLLTFLLNAMVNFRQL